MLVTSVAPRAAAAESTTCAAAARTASSFAAEDDAVAVPAPKDTDTRAPYAATEEAASPAGASVRATVLTVGP